MRKIKTVFDMQYDSHHNITMGDIRPECAWVFNEPGVIATIKFDGTATAIIDGQFFTRFDAKPGRNIPKDAVPCQPDPDPITGHWPHWVPVTDEPKFKWFNEAFKNSDGDSLPDGTFEAIGPHFMGNPYHLDRDELIAHGSVVVDDLPDKLSKDSLFDFFVSHPNMEGLVFYGSDNKRAKLRMKDFKLPWNNHGNR